MKKEIVLATLAILFIAGCTGGQLPIEIPWITSPTIFSGGGLVIETFEIDNTEVYNNRSAKISMTITNKGGAQVPDGEALALLQGSALRDDFASDGGLYWTERGATDSVWETMGKDMDPYDPVRDVPADEKIINWYLTSPTDIDPGTTRTDVFIGRLYYDYTTTVTGNVWIYTEAESDAAKAAGRSLNQNSFTSTAGPVALYVTVKPTNVIVDGDQTFTLQVKASSVGGGTVYSQGAVAYDGSDFEIDAETELNMVDVTVSEVTGWTGEEDCTDTLELTKGEATITCDVTVTDIPSTFRSDQLKVTAEYGYWVERTASVTVSGK
ncbi:MAG: hypothetical protein GTN36_03585 [Candidatus Aenigmarchaeota archaeon]|nr:hypothetical protein [Candidatus Aenigmarchaeota archaeon]